ncbi:hypothetical protein Solca_0283 [Solitalea canadensis DSM 3403]|uniref:Uncharacterized protein n=1 Tax=Solitalea canadensis (strain ATCC 29591 / DSM 3403 / JCM 21819 / LMG 8368 / NBRC 15130 / NCIMB 12057 / USAM 9D) TaxID=929556 RepID=H8KSW7_SOLCM|nr:hypothetical protein Solca_0283 [Solitalea canadensis DSM 3403]
MLILLLILSRKIKRKQVEQFFKKKWIGLFSFDKLLKYVVRFKIPQKKPNSAINTV